jgi:hypothetical protein
MAPRPGRGSPSLQAPVAMGSTTSDRLNFEANAKKRFDGVWPNSRYSKEGSRPGSRSNGAGWETEARAQAPGLFAN